ncbi:MAG: hypothetical protein EPO25_02375 [Gammaproteobacteria bacterium]|nr:MAG: hypothetical protein EPO25_02375 [Gammaproteobacteria bacterium]
MRTQMLSAAAFVLALVAGAAYGYAVPGTANVYGACEPGASICGETAAVTVAVAAGTSYYISATGTIDYDGGGSIASNGPDGVAIASSTAFQAFNNRIGPSVTNGSDVQRRFLAGVFLADSDPGSAPSAFAQTVDVLTIAPTALGQIFFIGDGETSSSVAQLFTAPTGATRLLLGFIDRCSDFKIGCFGDNTGSLEVTVSAVPLPAAAWLFMSAVAGLLVVGRKGDSPLF